MRETTYQKKKRVQALGKAHGLYLAGLTAKFIYECSKKSDEEIRQIYEEYKSGWKAYAKYHTDLKSNIVVNPDQFDSHIADFYNKVCNMTATDQVNEYKRISEVALEKTRVFHLAKFIKNSLKNPDKKIG